MAAFSGDSLGTLAHLGTARDTRAEFTFRAVQDETYRFAVGSSNGHESAFTSSYVGGTVDFGPTPSNDAWSQAALLTAANGTVTGSNRYATTEPYERIWDVGHSSVWWTFAAPADGWYRFWVDETHLPFTLSAYAHGTGGAGQYGRVDLKVEPSGEAFEFESSVFGGAISQQFVSSTEKGIRGVLSDGVIAGYPVERIKVNVFDGKEHPVDSKDIAFQIAGREAFRAAFRKAKPVLLEPIMDVRITVPEAMMGDIMSDLNTRRGRVQGMDTVGFKSVVTAEVPLAEMLRYGNDLRSMTGGRGIYTMDFNRYDRVPAYVQDEIVAEAVAAAEQ